MNNKVFPIEIEDIYRNLSEAEKKTYIKKHDIQVIVGLMVYAILLAIDIIAITLKLTLFRNKEVSILFIVFIVVFLLLGCVGIISCIKALKYSSEVKIKQYIKILGNQKEFEQSFRKNESTTETIILETPSSVELNTVAYLTNQIYERYSKNNELIEIISNNLDIPANIYSIESFCLPIQNYTVTTTTYKSVEGKKNHWEWEVINSKSNTEFKRPSTPLIPITDYSMFVDKMEITEKAVDKFILRSSFQELEDIFLLLKRQNIIKTEINTSIKPEWIEKAEFTAFLFMFRCYKLQNLTKKVNIVKQQLSFWGQSANNFGEQASKRDELNIWGKETTREILTTLYNFELFNKDEIINWYLFIEYAKEPISTPFTNLLYSKRNEAMQVIQDLDDNGKIALLKSRKYRHRHSYSIMEIDNMDGAQFEAFVAELFNGLGYKAENTKLSGDQGVDVVAKKGSQIIAIQAKHYNQPVGNHAIMEVVAGAKFYNATLCYVITNNYFTKSAKELANVNNVILWDREKLIEKLSEI